MIFSKKDSVDIDKLLASKKIIVGLDIGDKTIGVAVSDFRIKIASSLVTIQRKHFSYDCKVLLDNLRDYNVGLVVFGWPVYMNGTVSAQCEKILKFIEVLSGKIDVDFVKWDERFSTSVVDKIMIEADMSRKKRKQVVDKSAAAYILQGFIDFINRGTACKSET